MLKVAIVGCGGISRSHLNSWKQIPEAKIVGACDVLSLIHISEPTRH